MENCPEVVVEEEVVGVESEAEVDQDGDRSGDRQPRVRELGVGTGRAAGSRRTQFKPKGDPSGQRAARKPKPAKARPSPLLLAMRYVFQHDEDDDQTWAHFYCRQWFDRDPDAFLNRLADLEKAYAAQRR